MLLSEQIVAPIIVAVMGVIILIRRKSIASLLVQSKEKHIRGKELSDFEKAHSQFLMIAAGLFALGMGTYLTIKALII